MVDIQSPTAEIRRGKKERKKEREKERKNERRNHRMKIHRAAIKQPVSCTRLNYWGRLKQPGRIQRPQVFRPHWGRVSMNFFLGNSAF